MAQAAVADIPEAVVSLVAEVVEVDSPEAEEAEAVAAAEPYADKKKKSAARSFFIA